MFIKKNKVLITLVFIVTSCNIYIFFNRDDFAYLKQSSYAELYPVTGNPSVKKIVREGDSTLRVIPVLTATMPLNWVIIMDGTGIDTINAVDPVIKLSSGVHEYKLYTTGLPDTISIKAEYESAQTVKNIGKGTTSLITIYKSDFPDVTVASAIDKWKDDEIPVSKEEAAIIQSILKDSAGILSIDNTVVKIKKVGQYISSRLFGCDGFPGKGLNGLSVLEQYKAAFNGQKLWCGNYAQIINLFSRAAGIKTRMVMISRDYGNITGNVHVFNEYYIPEQKNWATTDFLFNSISFLDGAGKLLNAVELKNINPADSSVKVLRAGKAGTIDTMPVSILGPDFFEVYSRDKELHFYTAIYKENIYSFKQKIVRYFSKTGWYEIYSDNRVVDNVK